MQCMCIYASPGLFYFKLLEAQLFLVFLLKMLNKGKDSNKAKQMLPLTKKQISNIQIFNYLT